MCSVKTNTLISFQNTLNWFKYAWKWNKHLLKTHKFSFTWRNVCTSLWSKKRKTKSSSASLASSYWSKYTKTKKHYTSRNAKSHHRSHKMEWNKMRINIRKMYKIAKQRNWPISSGMRERNTNWAASSIKNENEVHAFKLICNQISKQMINSNHWMKKQKNHKKSDERIRKIKCVMRKCERILAFAAAKKNEMKRNKKLKTAANKSYTMIYVAWNIFQAQMLNMLV